VSVSAAADGAEAKAAARRWGFAADWHWLLGPQAQLAHVWRAYGIVRSGTVYVIDARGFERVGVTAPFLPQFVADDFRVLAREAAA
jgi:cytochrome oxidase Cu insertion factor (SCO1/SenC/PrrC family)